MKIEDVLTNLCYYDTRNPDGVIPYLTEEEIKEEGLTAKAKDDCSCDNCFYGRAKLAEYIIKLQTVKKMGAEVQKLATIGFVTDTDVSYYEIGEVEGSFQKDELKDYIKRFGHEKICSHLAFLQFQIWEALREVNSERENNGAKSCS